MHYVALIFLTLYTATSYGFEMVYKQVDPNGHVTLSDKPLDNPSETIAIESTPTTPPPNNTVPTAPVLSPPPTPTAQKIIHYSVEIQSPRPQETLEWTAEDVTIIVNVAPKLSQGAKLQLYHNGEPEGIAQTQTKFRLPALPRGAHTFSAAVVNVEETEVLALSAPVTVFQHRTSLLNHK